MKKIKNDLDIFHQLGDVKNKIIIDVGCGTGNLVRQFMEQNAWVIGLDKSNMLEKAKMSSLNQKETYVAGVAEALPMKDNRVDLVIFFASLHHVPELLMDKTIHEAYRILKPDGIAVFLEPMGLKGSYFEIIRLMEDEREIQKLAYKAIKNSYNIGFEKKLEEIVYLERSLNDFKKLLEIFVDDKMEREQIFKEAEKITKRMSKEENANIKDFRFKSIARLNILKKT